MYKSVTFWEDFRCGRTPLSQQPYDHKQGKPYSYRISLAIRRGFPSLEGLQITKSVL